MAVRAKRTTRGIKAAHNRVQTALAAIPRSSSVVDVVQLSREYTTVAISALAYIALKGKSELARIQAANSLLDRAWGKASDPQSRIEQAGLQVVVRHIVMSDGENTPKVVEHQLDTETRADAGDGLERDAQLGGLGAEGAAGERDQ